MSSMGTDMADFFKEDGEFAGLSIVGSAHIGHPGKTANQSPRNQGKIQKIGQFNT